MSANVRVQESVCDWSVAYMPTHACVRPHHRRTNQTCADTCKPAITLIHHDPFLPSIVTLPIISNYSPYIANGKIEELKRCLIPAVETFVNMAFTAAAKKKRAAPTDDDWESVLKDYKKTRS